MGGKQGSSRQNIRARKRFQKAGMFFFFAGRSPKGQACPVFSQTGNRRCPGPFVSRVRAAGKKKPVDAERSQRFRHVFVGKSVQKGILPRPCRKRRGKTKPYPCALRKQGCLGAVSPAYGGTADDGGEFWGFAQACLLLQPLDIGRPGSERAVVSRRRRFHCAGGEKKAYEQG